MQQEAWVFEMIPLAEEIKHGKGSPEKAARLAELILLLNAHLFDGGDLPQAWIPSPVQPAVEVGHEISELDEPFLDEESSGVHDISEFDLSCFDEMIVEDDDFDFSCFDEPVVQIASEDGVA